MEAVGHAGTCMGILAKDGIVLCAEKKNQHKLLDINPMAAEKIFQIDDHVAVGIAGITADANALIEQLRLSGRFFKGLCTGTKSWFSPTVQIHISTSNASGTTCPSFSR